MDIFVILIVSFKMGSPNAKAFLQQYTNQKESLVVIILFFWKTVQSCTAN